MPGGDLSVEEGVAGQLGRGHTSSGPGGPAASDRLRGGESRDVCLELKVAAKGLVGSWSNPKELRPT